MANKLVTVGEGESAYGVLMDVEEPKANDALVKFVPKLPYAEANAKTKAQLVDYVALAEADEEGEGEPDA